MPAGRYRLDEVAPTRPEAYPSDTRPERPPRDRNSSKERLFERGTTIEFGFETFLVQTGL
jgi:hypothetical protein